MSDKFPVIFGLRYLEEDASDVHDVVACNLSASPIVPAQLSSTTCDDQD